jgi:hypothetical protein
MTLDYNNIGGLKKELEKLFAVKQLCFSQNKSMMAMLNLQNRGITEDRILYINNLLKSKRWNMDTKPNSWIEK